MTGPCFVDANVFVYARDPRDGRKRAFGAVTVRSPFTLAVGEPGARYDVAPLTASRHRPRGRPKRAPAIAG